MRWLGRIPEHWGWRMAIGGGTALITAWVCMSIAIFKAIGG